MGSKKSKRSKAPPSEDDSFNYGKFIPDGDPEKRRLAYEKGITEISRKESVRTNTKSIKESAGTNSTHISKNTN